MTVLKFLICLGYVTVGCMPWRLMSIVSLAAHRTTLCCHCLAII